MIGVGQVVVLVRDYDEAVRFWVEAVGCTLIADDPRPDGSRWVVVRPGGPGCDLLLQRPATPEQQARVGDQTGGPVGFFLHTDDFASTFAALTAAGVTFAEEPRHEPYGSVTVFVDVSGNRWDLIQPA